jgi:TolB-like protein/Flp pilus assembly protein TadD
VLPFTNLSGHPEQDYFSDGLTEEMIAQLGRFCSGRIGIIARHSSMVFKQTMCRVSEIGEALRANYLLEGSVRRDGDRVRITARLVETAGETQLWSETYDRHLTDWLTVQADVAAGIAASLAIELICDKRDLPAERLPEPAAYQAYLKGRYFWNMPADDGIEQALSYFGQALRIDPKFAAAHASMARATVLRAEYYGDHPRRALERAQASAERALQLDSSQYRAHVALGDVRRMLYWDWRAAEDHYRRAIALNPSSESAHRSYAVMLAALSRDAEAEREAQRALELDPLCLVVNTSVAWIQYLTGDLEAAVERCRHVVDMSSRFMTARRLLGATYLEAGRYTEAIAAFEEGLAIAGDDPLQMAWLAHARGSGGDRRSASELMDVLLKPTTDRHVSAYHLALAYVGLGDFDAAFAALDRACADRDPVLLDVAVEPRFEPLRSHERYRHLLDRLGIPAPMATKPAKAF